MASGKLLRQLIKSGAESNGEAFRAASEQVIKDERAKHHHLLANDLEKILYGRPTISNGHDSLHRLVPHDTERGLPLLELREPYRRLDDIVLSDENRSLFDELLEEHHRSEVLKSHGLRPVDKLLFCGPPGCGKTLAAEVLASELSLPLALVRVDSLVSSYLGETAANIRQVFDFAARAPLIMLFDEFDSVAKERADAADHGELKRVVNAFLQMLDAYQGSSLLLAATNHEGVLDSAVWRRFDDLLVFERPDGEQLQRLLAMKLRGVRRDFELREASLGSAMKGMSHADVERVVRRAIKTMVLSGHEFLLERHVETALRREDARRARIKQS